MLKKIGLLVSLSILCSIFSMFLGWVNSTQVLYHAFVVALTCFLFEHLSRKLVK